MVNTRRGARSTDIRTRVSRIRIVLYLLADQPATLLRNPPKMSSSKGFAKRMGFKRTNTDQSVTVEQVAAKGTAEGSSHMVAGHGDANSIIEEVVRDISETEANHRLKVFRQDHKWDPNMPDDALEMVDVATDAHDHKGEAELVGEVIENSPYPEVSFTTSSHVLR